MSENNFENLINRIPAQIEAGINAAETIKVKDAFTEVVIAGMGGSSLPGEFLRLFAKELELKVPVRLWRDYSLPSFYTKNPLIIAVSYSGDTEETLSSFDRAVRQDLKTIAVTTGGKLALAAKNSKTEAIILPLKDGPTRLALPIMFAALLTAFDKAGLAYGGAKKLLAAAKKLNPESFKSKGEGLAEELYQKIPLVYASASARALAVNWKVNFNETAKIPSFWHHFPEWNHNEIVGFENKALTKEMTALIMESPEDSLLIKKRMTLASKILEDFGIKVTKLTLDGGNIWEAVFNNIIIAYWTTYFLAKKYGVDPASTPLLEDFKRQMS